MRARANRAIARGRGCQRRVYDHRFGGTGLGPGQCQFGHCHAGDLMSPEPKKMPALSSAPAAERMRLYRKRRRRGMRCLRIQIHVSEIDALIRKKYLDQQSRDDLKAVEYAIRTAVLAALANEA